MTLPFVNVGVRVTLFMHGMEPGSIMEHRATEYWQCTRTRTITLSTEMKRRKKKLRPHTGEEKRNDSILIKVYVMCFLMSFVGSVLHIWVLVLAPLNLVPRLLFTVFCQLLVSLNFMFMSLIRSLNYRINSELQKPPDIAIVTNGSRFSSFRWRMAWYIILDILPHSTESSSVPRMWTRSVKCMNKFKLHDWDHVMHNAMIQWSFR